MRPRTDVRRQRLVEDGPELRQSVQRAQHGHEHLLADAQLGGVKTRPQQRLHFLRGGEQKKQRTFSYEIDRDQLNKLLG